MRINIIDEDIRHICSDEGLPWKKLKNKSVLITGGNGYIANYIVRSLLQRNQIYGTNITVYALCRSKDKAKKRFADILGDDNLQLLIQDVCDEIDDKYRADYIIHAASLVDSYFREYEPYSIIKANVFAYDKILEKAKKWNTEKVLYFSSCGVYGSNVPDDGAEESYRNAVDFANPKNSYIFSKQMGEMMSCSFIKENKEINIVSVRPSIVYGPGQSYSQGKYFTDFMKNYLCDENIVLKSTGENVRTHIYLMDAVKGVFYVLLKGRNGEGYNIAGDLDNVCSIKQVAEQFCSYDKRISVDIQLSDALELQTLVYKNIIKNDKLKSLGWKNETSLKDGIWRTICWARKSTFLN